MSTAHPPDQFREGGAGVNDDDYITTTDRAGADPASALIRGLRRPGNEAQLTQAIAAVCIADGGFARAFVDLLLKTAADGPRRERATRLRGSSVPTELICRAEAHLRTPAGSSLGRVDLRFDGDGFTLFVENKLHSGYGHRQLARYAQAIASLPDAHQSGLVAITRDVPTYGERSLDGDDGWLGSVRWAHLRGELSKLPIRDRSLRQQWRMFVDVLDEEGALGSMEVDTALIRAWARYRSGRAELSRLLGQVWESAESLMLAEMKRVYARRGKPAELVQLFRRGYNRGITVHMDQPSVYFGFCIPAIAKDPVIWVSITGADGVPVLRTEVVPWEPTGRTGRDATNLRKASSALTEAGFETDGWRWSHDHSTDSWLDDRDVPAKLSELIGDDLKAIVGSRILDLDLSMVLGKERGGPPRHRRIPPIPE